MPASRLATLLKIGSILVVVFSFSADSQARAEMEMLFDRGLPAANLNVEPDHERSNLRWRAGYESDRFYGDDFVIGSSGDRYVINHVRTWAVLGYREEGPDQPDAVGDWFSQIQLLGGSISDDQLTERSAGELSEGSNKTSNPNIVFTQVTYPDAEGSSYFNFGPRIPVWQIDFYNLNWVVEGGQRYNFSVQGLGRQFLDTDYSHAWYNHASNAALSGTPQEAADDLMSIFSNTGEFLSIADAEEAWNKSTDLNVQIFGEEIEAVPELTVSDEDDEAGLTEIVHGLSASGFLTDKAYHRALREVEQGVVESRSQLLYQLVMQFTLNSEGEVDSVSANIFVQIPEGESFSEEEWETIQREWGALVEAGEVGFDIQTPAQIQDLLERLNETGILSEAVYNQLQNDAVSGTLFFEFDLYQRAATYTGREEDVDPRLVQPRLDEFKEAGILSEQGYVALLQALDESKLQTPIEFLDYIDQARVFDLSEYSPDPYRYFPEIHQSIAQMLLQNGLMSGEVGEFNLELIQEQVYGLGQDELPASSESLLETSRVYSAVVSVQVDGREYKQASYYSPPDDDQGFLDRIDSDVFIHLFNKILRDQASPYRLYSVTDFSPRVDYSRLGVIALTEAQADIYFGNWHEADYEDGLTSDRIEEVVTLLKDVGLLDHLSETELLEGEAEITQSYITHPYEILSAFKDVVLFFDWESAVPEKPYARFLEALAKISRGEFNPTEIDDGFDWDNETSNLAFTLNATRYSTALKFQDDWLDSDFFQLVKRAAAIELSEGQFYPLTYGYGTEGYIFLNDMQLQALLSQQLIKLATDEES